MFNPEDTEPLAHPAQRNLPPLARFGLELGFRRRKFDDINLQANSGRKGPNTVQIISGLMTFSTGIFLTAVRLYEPLFRVLLLQMIYQFFG